jgi:hypothetical protein
LRFEVLVKAIPTEHDRLSVPKKESPIVPIPGAVNPPTVTQTKANPPDIQQLRIDPASNSQEASPSFKLPDERKAISPQQVVDETKNANNTMTEMKLEKPEEIKNVNPPPNVVVKQLEVNQFPSLFQYKILNLAAIEQKSEIQMGSRVLLKDNSNLSSLESGENY